MQELAEHQKPGAGASGAQGHGGHNNIDQSVELPARTRYSKKGPERVKTWDPKVESGNIGSDLRNGAHELKQSEFSLESMNEFACYATTLGNADPDRWYNSISWFTDGSYTKKDDKCGWAAIGVVCDELL